MKKFPKTVRQIPQILCWSSNSQDLGKTPKEWKHRAGAWVYSERLHLFVHLSMLQLKKNRS